MMEFTVEDFPTPPFPITSIVKEFTFYTITNMKFAQQKKKKEKKHASTVKHKHK